MNCIKYFLVVICCLVLSGSVRNLSAQSLTDKMTDFYTQLNENDNQQVIIDVEVWEKGSPDKIIERDQFIFIHDPEGVYSKMEKLEAVQEPELTIRIDHQLKEIVLTDSPKPDKLSGNGFKIPGSAMQFDQLDSTFKIKESTKDNQHVFQIYQEDELMLVITFSADKLVELIQYPDEEIDYQGEQIKTTLKMTYHYHAAIPRLKIRDVVTTNTEQLKLKPKFVKYNLKDYRFNGE